MPSESLRDGSFPSDPPLWRGFRRAGPPFAPVCRSIPRGRDGRCSPRGASLLLEGVPMRRPPEDRSIVPFPTHAVSNMEWVPSGITERQKLAERLIAEECARRAKRHGMTRAQFLRTAAATATAFMVLNKLHGSTAFAVGKEHCDDLDAGRELLDRKMFVMD